MATVRDGSIESPAPHSPVGTELSDMKVTFILSALFAAGAERVISIMATYWARKGWGVTILSLDNGETPPFFEIDPAVCRMSLGLLGDSAGLIAGIRNNLKRVLMLRRAIIRSQPHTVISFVDKTNVLTLFATLGLKLEVMVSERTDPYQYSIGRIWGGLRWWVYSRADRIVVQTRGAQEYFLPKFQRRVTVIPNPVLPASSNHATLNNRATACMILAMGRLSKEKGFDDLLYAFRKVNDQHPGCTLTIIGEGPERGELELLRERLGLSGCVLLPGLVTTIEVFLRQASMFVLSSRFEGFPNALCEAMAYGLPVIATDCRSGPREIIRDGEDGLLVPPGDLDALAAAMDSLMSDPERRARLGGRAMDITQRFGVEKVMGMWEKILEPIPQ